jgi:hypothetical protein
MDEMDIVRMVVCDNRSFECMHIRRLGIVSYCPRTSSIAISWKGCIAYGGISQ